MSPLSSQRCVEEEKQWRPHERFRYALSLNNDSLIAPADNNGHKAPTMDATALDRTRRYSAISEAVGDVLMTSTSTSAASGLNTSIWRGSWFSLKWISSWRPVVALMPPRLSTLVPVMAA